MQATADVVVIGAGVIKGDNPKSILKSNAASLHFGNWPKLQICGIIRAVLCGFFRKPRHKRL